MLFRLVIFCAALGAVGLANAGVEQLPDSAQLLRFAQAAPAERQLPTPEEFRRLYDFIVNGGDQQTVPRELAGLLGWSKGQPVPSWRRGYSRRRVSDGALLQQYAADVPQAKLARQVILLSQVVPGDPANNIAPDTTLSFLFNESGRIVRTVEMFPERNFVVEEIRDGRYEKLGYDIWIFMLRRLPAQ